MARPASIQDLTGDRTVPFGNVDVEAFVDQADLLVAFAAFQKAVVKNGGVIKKGPYSRSSVDLAMAKTQAQLEQQLVDEQRTWDDLKSIYEVCATTGSAPESWKANSLAKWAEAEGLPSWEDAFTALLDDELAHTES